MHIFGIVGWKNSGKTGLMERLVAEFVARGVKVATIKHAHHDFEIDHEGRDSFRHRAAGASEVAIVSKKRWAVIHELQGADEPSLDDMIEKLNEPELVLVEGFKFEGHSKIICHRAANGSFEHEGVDAVAVASDVDIEGILVPRYDLDDTARIANFISYHLGM